MIRDRDGLVWWLGYGMKDRDSISGSGKRLSLCHRIQTRSAVSLPFYAMSIEVILPWEVKKLERETDNSFPRTADVTNGVQHYFWHPTARRSAHPDNLAIYQ